MLSQFHIFSVTSWNNLDGTWGAQAIASHSEEGTNWRLGTALTQTKISAETLAEVRAKAELRQADFEFGFH